MKKDINIYFTWIKEGRDSITCGITPLNIDYLWERMFEMSMQMSIAKWHMDKKSNKEYRRIMDNITRKQAENITEHMPV
jgi:hypothetical protein